MDRLVIRRPDDWHLHLRQGDILRAVLPFTERDFRRGLVMPNTSPPVVTGEDVERYRAEIHSAKTSDFEPLMTIKITPWTTPSIVGASRAAGAIAGKLYPEGVTTGADVGGVQDFRALWPVFEAMQEVDMVLCLHGELPSSSVLARERDFLPRLYEIAQAFPRLRIVLEHISTAVAVETVRSLVNVAATITAHHLALTIDDVLSDRGLRPHHFCKPVVKLSADRDALIEAATSDSADFFFGSDSAPHPRSQKESSYSPTGVFAAPVALSIVAEVFARAGKLERLEAFTAVRGADFYGVPLNGEMHELARAEWTIPESYGDLVPLCAGATVTWGVKR